MKKLRINLSLLILLISFLSVMFTGCELIGDIFQAGIWVGILAVVGIIALLAFIFRKK